MKSFPDFLADRFGNNWVLVHRLKSAPMFGTNGAEQRQVVRLDYEQAQTAYELAHGIHPLSRAYADALEEPARFAEIATRCRAERQAVALLDALRAVCDAAWNGYSNRAAVREGFAVIARVEGRAP